MKKQCVIPTLVPSEYHIQGPIQGTNCECYLGPRLHLVLGHCALVRAVQDLLGTNVYKLSLEYPHLNLSTVPVSKYKVETLYPGAVVSTLFVSSEAVSRNYNRQQNELRHFAENLAFLCFTDFKRRKYCFSSPIPSMQCCANV